jgi:hypothetical protein
MPQKTVVSIAAALLVCLLVAGIWLVRRAQAPPKFKTPYQAVLLDNNQVYFGKLEGLGKPSQVLTDVFYVRSDANPETKQHMLVRRGRAWHQPDRRVINANHVLVVEPVPELEGGGTDRPTEALRAAA